MLRVRTPGIIKVQIPTNRGPCIRHRVVGSKVDLLILDGPPEPFDEDVVAPGTLAIHADRDLVLQQQIGEVRASELAPLIGVEDVRLAMPGQGFLAGQLYMSSSGE